MLEIHLQNPLTSPAFPHLYAQSPTSCLLISLPCYLFFFLPISLLPYLPVSPSLSFCVSYYPALLYLQCSAALAIRILHTPACTHTHGETHAHDFRQSPSLSHTSPLQTRNTLQPPVCQFLINRHHFSYSILHLHTIRHTACRCKSMHQMELKNRFQKSCRCHDRRETANVQPLKSSCSCHRLMSVAYALEAE